MTEILIINADKLPLHHILSNVSESNKIKNSTHAVRDEIWENKGIAQFNSIQLHVWKNIFGVKDLNRKTIPTLLSLPLYIVWARMNTRLQLIVYHIDGKMCGQCWWEHWGRTCKHSGISVLSLSFIFYYNKSINKTCAMTYVLVDVWRSGHPSRPGRLTPRT